MTDISDATVTYDRLIQAMVGVRLALNPNAIPIVTSPIVRNSSPELNIRGLMHDN
ncbi:MAG: hypothetical protein ACR2PC_16030 [Tsuneonella suprasediminis]